MTVRFYSSTAQQTSLTGTITGSDTTIAVGATTGFPASTPFTLALDYGAINEELVDVTNVAGLSLTVTRAADGTSATGHNAGAVVRHVSSARDFSDSRSHENASSGVHGLVGALVGLTDVQTLTNKTLTSPIINTPTINTPSIANPSITGNITFSGQIIGSPEISGDLMISATAPATTVLDVRGAAAQTADLQVWQDSVLSVLASIDAAGTLTTSRGHLARGIAGGEIPLTARQQSGGLPDPLVQVWEDAAATQVASMDATGLLTASTYSFTGQNWDSYSPVWTSSGVAPVLGNGSLIGRFCVTGKTTEFYFVLVFGTTTTAGTGSYSFTLPATSAAFEVQSCYGQGVASGTRVPINGTIGPSVNTVTLFAPTAVANTTLTTVSSSGLTGSAWNTGSFLRIQGTFEAA